MWLPWNFRIFLAGFMKVFSGKGNLAAFSHDEDNRRPMKKDDSTRYPQASSQTDLKPLHHSAQQLGLNNTQRHIFFCVGEACNGDCSRGEQAWAQLKDRLSSRRLTGPGATIQRTKVHCLRLCQQGPIAVVYPEGTWYHHLEGERLERVIDEHLVEGQPVIEFAFHQRALPQTAVSRTESETDGTASE